MLKSIPPKSVIWITLPLSGLIAGALIWLVYFYQSSTPPTETLSRQFFQNLNATFNAISAICLTAGWIFIKKGHRERHQKAMIAAVVSSALFLISYITYHSLYGDAKFLGEGWIRPVYFFILITHIGLSIAALPLILSTLLFAFNRSFPSHKKIARWTLPLWLYVSVTGVLIVLLLSLF